jgi:hypothetical protein
MLPESFDDVEAQYPELPDISGSPGIVVSYPEALQPWLIGILAEALDNAWLAGDYDSNRQTLDTLIEALITPMSIHEHPTHTTIMASEMSNPDGSMAALEYAAAVFGQRASIGARQLNEYLSFDWYCPGAGTYDFRLGALKSSSAPVIQLIAQGNRVLAQFDLYQSSTAYVVLSGTFTMSYAGLQTLQIKIVAKHPSSTGYNGYISGISIRMRYV